MRKTKYTLANIQSTLLSKEEEEEREKREKENQHLQKRKSIIELKRNSNQEE